MDWRTIGLVAIGGALGAVARFATSSALPRTAFPWATLSVNLIGSFAIGYLFLAGNDQNHLRPLLAAGFLGAFTTLSTYSFETVTLWQANRVTFALANMLANGLGGPLMALLGFQMHR